jgi:predicted ester cyclase
MTKQERDLGRRWFEEVWNKGRREAIAEMLAPAAVLHEAGIDSVGAEGFYPLFDRLSATFSEINVSVDDVMVDGDKICVRWSFSGKHTGGGLGFAATGMVVRTTGITIVRVSDGMLIEGWQNWDMLGMMQQIQGGHKAATYVSAPPQISATNAV